MHTNIIKLMYHNYFKRAFDLILSFVALSIAMPVFIPVFLILLFQNKGRAFFFQARPGFQERAFNIVKFKTMTDEKNSEGNLLSNHLRITKAGRFLRKYSLDELPQLINVIKGDMSLVGPRPLLFNYIPLYSKNQKKRHLVKPGITGWAQVNGRNAISWTRKFELDVYYVENATFFFDLKILWLTVLKVLKKEGINASERENMAPFDGSN